ncbi:MAG: ribonuclease H-like domain-containing protein [Candidatus Bathyarchaeia archaeon]
MGDTILDIETAPLELRDTEVIDYLINRRTRTDLHPVFSRIVVIGLKEIGKEPIQFYGEDEQQILRQFWNYLQKHPNTRFITFNGYQLDIPFIYVRSRINKIIPTIEIERNSSRMENSNHFDCMLALSHYNTFRWVALDILCKIHGIPVPEGRIHGNQIAHLYKKGDWKHILMHNQNDLVLTEKLYEKFCQ